MAATTQPATATPPPPEPPASGSAPGWVNFLAKNKTLAVICVGTGLVMYSSKSTNKAANEVQAHFNTAAGSATAGPRLSAREKVDSDQQVQAALARYNKSQADLDAKLKALNEGTGAGRQAQPSAPQLSPEQQIAQQIRADRAKAAYESLWSSPIVATRGNLTQDLARNIPSVAGGPGFPQPVGTASLPMPTQPGPVASLGAPTGALGASAGNIAPATEGDPNKARFAYDASVGPYHMIPRYTLVGGTLLNQVNSQTGGMVIVRLDPMDKVYVPGSKTLLLPEGTQLLGEAQTITQGGGGQKLLMVSFDQIRTPDYYSISIPKMAALSENGQTGVPGHVDNHVISTIGWSIMLAGFAGMSEIGNSTSALVYSPSSTFRQQFSDSLGQQSIQQLSQHVANRPTTIIIPAGTRVKAVLADDLPGVPEWLNHRIKPGTL
jgi:type IV secretory pathway VirB10-like protein